jgi:hypothetical protein
MKVYIQSKSGNYNVEIYDIPCGNLCSAMGYLRDQSGGFYSENRGEILFIPFEEIEYIKEVE